MLQVAAVHARLTMHDGYMWSVPNTPLRPQKLGPGGKATSSYQIIRQVCQYWLYTRSRVVSEY